MTRLAVAAVASGALIVTAPASAATYPDPAGSAFISDAEHWISVRADCQSSAPLSVCTQENAHSAAAGNPPGSLASTTRVTNAAGLFTGEASWSSPSFIAGAGAGQAGTLQYDRRLEISGILSLQPSAEVRIVVVLDGSGSETTLDTETLTQPTDWSSRSVAVAPGTMTAGQSYHLELRSTATTTAAQAGTTGETAVRFDNVALALPDPIRGGPSGSPGVVFTGDTLSSAELNALMARVNYAAEVGRGPGGSVVPINRCTVVGTRGNDRITATAGNDVICGLGGNDVINGAGSRDIVDAGDGNDRLSGSSGADVIIGVRGKDRLNGGSGNDRLGGGSGADRLAGSSGRDRLNAGSGNDRLAGGAGNDVLRAGKGRDSVNGDAGNDQLLARDRARDRVMGGRGRDRASVDRRVAGKRRADIVRSVERGGR